MFIDQTFSENTRKNPQQIQKHEKNYAPRPTGI